MNTKNLGNTGELKTALEFSKKGIPVYFPFGDNESADLIAEFNGKLNKIQVKSTNTSDGETVTFSLVSSMVGYSKKYSSDDVDYFALYDNVEDNLYFIPYSERTSIVLRLKNSRQKKGVNFAKDLLFEEIFSGVHQP